MLVGLPFYSLDYTYLCFRGCFNKWGGGSSRVVFLRFSDYIRTSEKLVNV